MLTTSQLMNGKYHRHFQTSKVLVSYISHEIVLIIKPHCQIEFRRIGKKFVTKLFVLIVLLY